MKQTQTAHNSSFHESACGQSLFSPQNKPQAQNHLCHSSPHHTHSRISTCCFLSCLSLEHNFTFSSICFAFSQDFNVSSIFIFNLFQIFSLISIRSASWQGKSFMHKHADINLGLSNLIKECIYTNRQEQKKSYSICTTATHA